jgi:uncharacterized protein
MSEWTGDAHGPSPLTNPRAAKDARPDLAPPQLDGSRPFGVHIRMARWKSLVLIAALALTLIVSQLGFYLVAGAIEGGDPFASELTPLKLAAANLSTGVTALLALALVGWFAKVPWRAVFSSPRRFDTRRLMTYFLGSLLIVGVAMALVGLIAPEAVGWSGFGITGTTIGILVVVVLTTPMQTLGEEIMLRGAVLPAAGSWFRAVKPALILGIAVSSLLFAVLHGSTDPMLFTYYLVFSVSVALMGVLTRGLEAAIAFHTANNLIVTTLNALLTGGGAIAVERSAGEAGGRILLLPMAACVAALVVVWLVERRQRRA